MKETILDVFKFLTKIDVSKGISRRLYPKLLASLKTFPKSTYARTSRGIYASAFGNFWWVKGGDQKYGWERTLCSIIRNFDCVDNTDVCDCRTFMERAAKLTRAREPYWIRCYFYEYNMRTLEPILMPLMPSEKSIPDIVVVTVDDVVALLVEAMLDESGKHYFEITNYCFIRGTQPFGNGLLEMLQNDKALRKP